MDPVILTPPNSEAVSLATAKAHCNVTHTADDSLFPYYIKAARERVEKEIGVAVLSTSYRWTTDRFPATRDFIRLPRAPVSAVASVIYRDWSGQAVTLDPTSYRLVPGKPSRIVLTETVADWPFLSARASSLAITFTAGYASADAVPGTLVAAMLLMIGHYYANREENVIGTIVSELPGGVRRLLDLERWT